MSRVRIGLANLRFPDSIDDGVSLARAAIRDAGAAGVEIVCFPECFVPGYRAPHRTVAPPDEAAFARAWDAIAASAREAKVAVVLGTERIVDGAPRITALVIDKDGERLGFQDKVQLDPAEDAFYTPGAGRRVFTCGALTFGVAICHEGWRYPETVRAAARAGAQLVFHPHYAFAEGDSFRPTTFLDPRNTFHEQAMRCRAAENTIYFASVNYAEDGSPTTSAIVRPDGSVLAWQPYAASGLLIADLELDDATGYLAGRCRS
ncbi:MAG TPA: carbon-nitrogen hydrolase family protein [Kofleriaceae bacterium]|nr:carbon-nitrogen hydrolase family protein [Kofleriaceae bacterium]